MSRKRDRKERKAAQAARKRYHTKYPSFRFTNEEEAPAQLVAAVKDATRKVDFDTFDNGFKMVLQHFKYDPNDLTQQLLEHDLKRNGIGTAFISDLASKIGERIYNAIGVQKLSQWVPYCCPEIRSISDTINIQFTTLKSVSGKFGKIYYPKEPARVQIKDVSYNIGWSRHAIEQICHRIAPTWPSYDSVISVLIFLTEEKYQFCRLVNGDPAIVLFDRAVPRMFNSLWVEKLLGEKTFDIAYDYWYRIGYSPIMIEGDFAKALTMLCPGYRQTPEYQYLKSLRIPNKERQKLLDDAANFSSENLLKTRDFSLIKKFHDGGIPQIIKIPKRNVPTLKQKSTSSSLWTKNINCHKARLIFDITDPQDEQIDKDT